MVGPRGFSAPPLFSKIFPLEQNFYGGIFSFSCFEKFWSETSTIRRINYKKVLTEITNILVDSDGSSINICLSIDFNSFLIILHTSIFLMVPEGLFFNVLISRFFIFSVMVGLVQINVVFWHLSEHTIIISEIHPEVRRNQEFHFFVKF